MNTRPDEINLGEGTRGPECSSRDAAELTCIYLDYVYVGKLHTYSLHHSNYCTIEAFVEYFFSQKLERKKTGSQSLNEKNC